MESGKSTGESKGAGGESKRGAAAPRVPARITQSTPTQRRAIARGRTVGQAGRRRHGSDPYIRHFFGAFNLPIRGYRGAEGKIPAGDALRHARTKGVMRDIGGTFLLRQRTGEIARAMGRQNLPVQYLKGKRLKTKKKVKIQHKTQSQPLITTVTAPGFLTRKISHANAYNVSDLTKTLSGAPTIRRGRFAADARLKTPSKGGRRTRKRKFKRKRKRKTRHKSKRRRTRRRRKRTRRRRGGFNQANFSLSEIGAAPFSKEIMEKLY